jgi:hypothetical protein
LAASAAGELPQINVETNTIAGSMNLVKGTGLPTFLGKGAEMVEDSGLLGRI